MSTLFPVQTTVPNGETYDTASVSGKLAAPGQTSLLPAAASQDIYVGDWSAQGGSPGTPSDSNDGLTPNFPVATITKARELRAVISRGRNAWSRIQYAAGPFTLPGNMGLAAGPDGLASPESWVCTTADQLGNRAVSAVVAAPLFFGSPLANKQHITDASIASLRSGSSAVVTQVTGAGQARVMTVSGMVGLVAGDVGKNFLFALSPNRANNGTFKMASLAGGLAGNPTFFNAQAVVEGSSLYWQDSFKGATIEFGAKTSIAAGSNGQALPQAIINVVGVPAGTPASGTIKVLTDAGLQAVAYTGTTGTSYTGCTGGTGTMHTGGAVTNAFGAAAAQGARRITGYGGIASAQFTVSLNPTAGDTLVINDGTNAAKTITWASPVVNPDDVLIGASAAASAANLVAKINGYAPTVLRVRATVSGSTALVKLRNMIAGSVGNTATPTITGTAWATSITTFAVAATGAGNPLTTFTIHGAGFSPAPVASDVFTVEKPGTIFTWPANAGFNGTMSRIGIINAKFVLSANAATVSLIWILNKCEFDCATFNVRNTVGGAFQGGGGIWLNDSANNPFATLNAGSYFHNGRLVLVDGIFSLGVLTMDSCTFQALLTGQPGSLMDCERTTVTNTSRFTSGDMDGRFDNAFLSTDSIINMSQACQLGVGTGAGMVLDNAPVYAINMIEGCDLTMGNIAGDSTSSKAAVHVDGASRLRIDVGATSALTSGAGDFEFGRETVPNIVSYATIRTVDANGVKGYPQPGDARASYGNRADVN